MAPEPRATRFPAVRGHRRGSAGTGNQARCMAQSTGCDRSRSQKTHAHQSLQCPPSMASGCASQVDEAVFAAYGWPPTLTDKELLERLLRLNHERAASVRSETPIYLPV